MAGSLIVAAGGHEHVSQDVLNRWSERVSFFGKAQLLECLVDSTERPKKIVSEMKVRLRVARVELDRAPEALFGRLPFRVACVSHPQCVVRFGQERVQPDRL